MPSIRKSKLRLNKDGRATKAAIRLAAQIIGHQGGIKGGPARAAKMTAKERSKSARKAVKARWKKYRDEKLKASQKVKAK